MLKTSQAYLQEKLPRVYLRQMTSGVPFVEMTIATQCPSKKCAYVSSGSIPYPAGEQELDQLYNRLFFELCLAVVKEAKGK